MRFRRNHVAGVDATPPVPLPPPPPATARIHNGVAELHQGLRDVIHAEIDRVLLKTALLVLGALLGYGLVSLGLDIAQRVMWSTGGCG